MNPSALTRELLGDLPLPELVSFYQDLHAHPELSMREHRTASRLAGSLRAAGYETTEGVGGTGVAALLRNGDGPVVLLRADLDALPLAEETGLPYASTVEGVMHACGHDLHTTCLAGAARALAEGRDAWSGTLLVIGQPGEETAEGALAMLRDGLFDRFPRPDVALGQHVGPAPAGSIGHRAGLIMSAAVNVDIRIFGRGGHGASPELCVDPVVTAAYLVTRLQTVVSREIAATEPVVLTVGQIRAGTKANIIPEDAHVVLNLRTRSQAARDRVVAAVHRIAEAECAASGCPRPPLITTSSDFPVTVNDADVDARVRAVHEDLFGAEAVVDYGPLMGSEDFPIFGMPEHNGGTPVPYAFWFFGGTGIDEWVAAEGDTPMEKVMNLPANHTPRFAPDAGPSVRSGVTALTAAALAYLS
ncbi:MAG: amidohydrolase [Nonomuraea sp.]|nr:amidohydrolase [Nonomuraea sp.]